MGRNQDTGVTKYKRQEAVSIKRLLHDNVQSYDSCFVVFLRLYVVTPGRAQLPPIRLAFKGTSSAQGQL